MQNGKGAAPLPGPGRPVSQLSDPGPFKRKASKSDGFFANLLNTLGASGSKLAHSRKAGSVTSDAASRRDSHSPRDDCDSWLKAEGWKEFDDTCLSGNGLSGPEACEKKTEKAKNAKSSAQLHVVTDAYYDVGSAASAGASVVTAALEAAREAPSPLVTSVSSKEKFSVPVNRAEGPSMMVNTDDPVALEALIESESLCSSQELPAEKPVEGEDINEWMERNGTLLRPSSQKSNSSNGKNSGFSEEADRLSMSSGSATGTGSSGMLPVPRAQEVVVVDDDATEDKDSGEASGLISSLTILGESNSTGRAREKKRRPRPLGGPGTTHSSANTLCSDGGRVSIDSSIPSSTDSESDEILVDASLLISEAPGVGAKGAGREGSSIVGGDGDTPTEVRRKSAHDETPNDDGETDSTLDTSASSHTGGHRSAVLLSSSGGGGIFESATHIETGHFGGACSNGHSAGSGDAVKTNGGSNDKDIALAHPGMRESWQEVTLDPKLWGEYLKVDVVERDRYGFRLDEEMATNESYARKHAERIERARSSWDMFYRKPGFRSTLICKGEELKQFIRKNGIPYNRGQLWLELSGCRQYRKRNESSFTEMLQKAESGALDCDTKRQIEKDLRRTFPENEWYESDEGIESLGRLLSAFGVGCPAVGYMQSINFVGGLLLLFMSEEDSYHMLRTITGCLLPDEYYSDNMIGLQADLRVFDELLAKKLPQVSAHLKAIGCSTSFFTTQWFLCLFVNALPLECTLRIWDCFFCEGSKVMFRFGLAIVYLVSDVIMSARDGIEASCQMKEAVRKLYDVDLLVRTAYESSWMGRVSRSAIRRSRDKHRKALIEQFQLDPNSLKDLMANVPKRGKVVKDATARETIVGNLMSFFGENLNDAQNTPSSMPDFFI